MGRIDTIAAELAGDPLTRGYSGMSDAAAAADMNTVYRERNLASLTGSEVINAVDKTEWDALTDAQKAQVWDIVHLGTVNPFGIEADLFQDIFGASNTITALQALRKEGVSRGVELGVGHVWPGHIQTARL